MALCSVVNAVVLKENNVRRSSMGLGWEPFACLWDQLKHTYLLYLCNMTYHQSHYLATSLGSSRTATKELPTSFQVLSFFVLRAGPRLLPSGESVRGTDQTRPYRPVSGSPRVAERLKCPTPYAVLSWPLPIVTPTPRGRHLARRGGERLGGIGNNKSRGTCCSLCSPSKSGWCSLSRAAALAQSPGAGEQMEQVHQAVGDY